MRPHGATIAGVIFLGHLASGLLIAADDDDAPLRVAMQAVPLEQLKDWKFEQPKVLKFTGTLPVSDNGGQPITGRVAGDVVYVSLGQFGQKTIKAGDRWAVDVGYGEGLTERYNYKLEKAADGSLTVCSAYARLGAWNGKQFALIDVNSNGRYDDADDQIILDKTTLLKAGDELPGNSDRLTLKPTASGKELLLCKDTAFSAAMLITDTSVDGALLTWNTVRRSLRLQPVTRDPELERIGALHVKYMGKHGLGHPEDKSAADYTADGNKAGMGSVLSFGRPNAREAILGLLDTFYHRVQMLQPDLAVTGINYEDRYGAANVHNGPKRKVSWTEPFAYPPDGAIHVRPGWSGMEGPSPIPEVPKGGVGQTVTLTFPSGKKVKNGTIVLHEGGASGPSPDAWVSAPDKPAAGGAGMFPNNMNSICLIAKAPLKTGTLYVAEATAEVDGRPFKQTWSFTTDKGGGPRPPRR